MMGGEVGTGAAIGASFAGEASGTGDWVWGAGAAQETVNKTEVTSMAPVINLSIFMLFLLSIEAIS
jgi:hypothetical protein